MPKLEGPQAVVQRLRGHWRLNVNEPLWGRSAVLALQRVLDDEAEARLPHRAGWCLGPDSFAQLLDSLSESAQIVSLESALQLHHDARPRIALTFDGGWQDLNHQVAPTLERRALPASIFLAPLAAPRFRAPWQAVLGEALWQRTSAGPVDDAFGDAGLPAPPPVAARDARYSQTILNYLTPFSEIAVKTLDALATTLLPASGLADQALDTFSVRRLEQGGLLRFGSLLPRDADAASQRIPHDHQRLQALCESPLPVAACDEEAISDAESLGRLIARLGLDHVLTRQPGWLSLPAERPLLPRFTITQPLANSPGLLFDRLLGNLSS
ncbi:polysaccharide deacetylase family protein [Salinicola avicenniae]|uniref:polysaccharide deacetylase family protein n=1 Tax=Salinicola avicenniae TaxID=2916836 RepID=UPI0020739A8A|nr:MULTISPECIES: polysaccharide deacetylase family protein [unclassified Salinicola]